jgi:hypothetical protein
MQVYLEVKGNENSSYKEQELNTETISLSPMSVNAS